MVKINGKEYDCLEISLVDYLNHNNFAIDKIAIEYNGNILPKSQYSSTYFKDGDSIEIVSFVGGG